MKVQERLSDEEWDQLKSLLIRYCEFDLDQFDNWRVSTKFGPVYIQLTRRLDPGVSEEYYVLLK